MSAAAAGLWSVVSDKPTVYSLRVQGPPSKLLLPHAFRLKTQRQVRLYLQGAAQVPTSHWCLWKAGPGSPVRVRTHHHSELLLKDVFVSAAGPQDEGQRVFSGLQGQHGEAHLTYAPCRQILPVAGRGLEPVFARCGPGVEQTELWPHHQRHTVLRRRRSCSNTLVPRGPPAPRGARLPGRRPFAGCTPSPSAPAVPLAPPGTAEARGR